jgi:flagellar biosynthetic protein FlhB
VSSGENRTEDPTPKRRSKARDEGQVARSAEVNSAVVLIATVAVLMITGGRLLTKLEAVMSGGLARAFDPTSTGTSAGWAMRSFAGAVAPVLLVALAAGVAANVAQVRLRFSTKLLRPKFSKLNPLQGIKRLFSPQSFVELLKSLAKTTIVGGIAYMTVGTQLTELGALVGAPPSAIVAQIGSLVSSVAIRVAAAMAVLAALDYAWQRRKHEKSLKMTKDEVKQEARQTDVSPEIKGAIRRRQVEQARRRMLADVPTADVVIVNPTHFAVALRYDGTTPAPEVVAKGMDLVAAAIRRTAEEAGVPIVSQPPLARALYREVDLGRQIPEGLFASVAEVLAFVYRTAGRRRDRLPRRSIQPALGR